MKSRLYLSRLIQYLCLGISLILLSGCFSTDNDVPSKDPTIYHFYSHLTPQGNKWIQGTSQITSYTPKSGLVECKPDLVAGSCNESKLDLFMLCNNSGKIYTIAYQKTDSGRDSFVSGKKYLLPDYPMAGRLEFNGETWRGIDESLINDSLIIKNLIPHGKTSFSESGDMYFLGGATTRYGHAILGDDQEASLLLRLTTDQKLDTLQNLGFDVYESLQPLLADFDGDQQDEIVLTRTNSISGAFYEVLNEDGSIRARGPAIGSGYRWRHQIAVAPFAPDGSLELAGVKTPHIGGVVEFFALEGDTLKLRAELPGYSSHQIESPNLDMALAGDFNGNGKPELVVPAQDYSSIHGIERTGSGAEEVWSRDLPGTLISNLYAFTNCDGSLSLVLGYASGIEYGVYYLGI